jgi:hypothetical protein
MLSMKQNINILTVALLLPAEALLAQDSKLENPLPGKKVNAAFENAEEGPATVKVSTNDGKLVLNQQLRKQTIENAKWTNDGNYLVVIGRNSDGHSPWRCIAAVFSVADREVRLVDDTKTNLPIISSEIRCEGPDGVELTAHTFKNNKPAPDDPIKVNYSMSKDWPSLKKVQK